MGEKTKTEFEDELRLNIGDNDFLDDNLTSYINIAYLTITTQKRVLGINRDVRFPELEVFDDAQFTSDGQPYINVPINCHLIRYLWDKTNDTKLNAISHREYIKKSGRADSDAEDKPLKWVRRGTFIFLYPTPDAAYNMYVYYKKRPIDLSDDVETTAIGAEWDEAILQMAVYQTHLRLGEFDHAKVKKEYLMELLHSLAGMYDEEHRDRKDIFRPDETYLRLFKY